MKDMKKLIVSIVSFGLLPFTLAGQTIRDEKCLVCHAKKSLIKVNPDRSVKSLYVDIDILKLSVHRKKSCTDCHYDVKEIPHKMSPRRVRCTRCHYKGNPEGAPSWTSIWNMKEVCMEGELQKEIQKPHRVRIVMVLMMLKNRKTLFQGFILRMSITHVEDAIKRKRRIYKKCSRSCFT